MFSRCIIRLLFLIACFTHHIHAKEGENPNPTGPEPTSLVNRTAGPSAIVNGSVNAISGDYNYSSVDYTLTGPDPYILGRSYSSSSNEKLTLGTGWSFFHPTTLQVFQPEGINYGKALFPSGEEHAEDDDVEDDDGEPEDIEEITDPKVLKAMELVEDQILDGTFYSSEPQSHLELNNLEPKTSSSYTQLILSERGGGSLQFRGHKRAKFFEPQLKKTGWTNASGEQISGTTNVKNIWVHRDRDHDRFIVRDADATLRIYTRKSKQSYPRFSESHPNMYFRNYILREERKPSGNRVKYKYSKRLHLIEVKTYNATREKVLNWVTFSYRKNEIVVKTSDGTRYAYGRERDGEKRTIKKFIHPTMPKEHLRYHKKRLVKTEQNNNFLETYYFDSKPFKNRVSKQRAPAGIGGRTITTHRFSYHKGEHPYTKVEDAKGYKSFYYYNKHKRLTRLEKRSRSGRLLSSERFHWGDDADDVGNLLSRTLYNEKMERIFSRHYHYDDRHNVVKEELCGLFTGNSSSDETIKLYTRYSNDCFNLKTQESDAEGNITYYYYRPKSNLLTAKLICNGNKIRKRQFFKYDHSGVLLEEINDDGHAKSRRNLNHVTMRLIKRIKPRYAYPHFGEPEVIEELAYNPETKKEIPLKKAINIFNNKGLVTRKKVYDATGRFMYENRFSYDDAGRVVQSLDSEGRTSRCRYNDMGKVIYSNGPNKDVETHIIYDTMGRPIKTQERRHGKKLTSTIKHDELGRKVGVTDAQGNETRYEYDGLDRIIKISKPPVPDETGTLIPSVKTFQYENGGLTIRETNERGFVTTTYLNALGKPIKVHAPNGAIECFEYDLRGNLIKSIAPSGLVTTNTYDYQNRLIKSTEQNGNYKSTKKLTYDAFHLIKEESPTGETISYTYDYAGRKATATRSSPDQSLTRHTSFHYDTLGRLVEERSYIDDGYIAKCLAYDTLDRVVQEELKDHENTVYSYKTQTYDDEGNINTVVSFVDGKLSTTKTTYYAEGLPSRITDACGNLTCIHYDFFFPISSGQHVVKKTIIDALGIKTEELLNAQGNVSAITRYDYVGNILSREKKFYDPAGNLIKVIEGIDKEVVTTLTYDPSNKMSRLTQATGTPEEKTTCFFYNGSGQLATTVHANGATISCSYDAKGRLTRHVAPSFDYSFTYDLQDKVVIAKNNKNGSATKRCYDGLGQMILETLESGLTLSYRYDQVGRVAYWLS